MTRSLTAKAAGCLLAFACCAAASAAAASSADRQIDARHTLKAVQQSTAAVDYHSILALYQYDRKQPLSVVVTGQKNYPECLMLRISYASANGERVPAVVFEPYRASLWHPVPALILLHGLGGSKEDLVPFGHFLAATGYASLIIDEYGHGERANEDSGDSAAVALRGFEQTVMDVRRGIDYLQSRPHISPHRIGVLGFSLGAIIGADAMGIDPRLKAGVLISGGGDIGVILKHLDENSPSAHRRMAGVNWNLANVLLTPADPLTFAGHIGARPVLMQNGTDDKIVIPACATALDHAIAAAKGSRVQLDWYQGAGHILPLDKIYPPMRVWLDKNLKGEMNGADTEISGP